MKGIGLLILIVFYAVYISKAVMQKRKGIQTDQIARGKEKSKVFYTELVMKAAAYSVIAVEVWSVFRAVSDMPGSLAVGGAVLGLAGDVLFAVSVLTMKDSWRAGIAEKDKTEMVTEGIYSISRNPAFLAFDCVYAGLLCMFFNWPLLLFSAFAIIMLHLQILQEEKFLERTFGREYLAYKSKVRRYLGRK